MIITVPLNLVLFFCYFVAMKKTVTLVPGSDETCEICETVMTYLKNVLADNATKVSN